MINIYLCIIWPVLITGIMGSYWLGKKYMGRLFSFLAPLIFITLAVIALRLILGLRWLDYLWVPYFAQ